MVQRFILRGLTLTILKPQGVMRVIVPDLESVVKNYLCALEQVESGVIETEPNYDWMMLELYDQTVHNFSSGEMGCYSSDPNIKNKEFVISHVGHEAEKKWLPKDNATNSSFWEKLSAKKPNWFIKKFRNGLAENLVNLIARNEAKRAFEEGLFRNSGEIHLWMYDRFSLRRLLEHLGFVDVRFFVYGRNQTMKALLLKIFMRFITVLSSSVVVRYG